MKFDFQMPKTVRFGLHTFATLKDEIQLVQPNKIGIISDKGLEKAGVVQKVKDLLEPTAIPLMTFTDIAGEPSFQLLQEAIAFLQEAACDIVIGIGGGTAMDVAKASAALLDKEDVNAYLYEDQTIEERTTPCILLPTTSGTGAEVTMNAIFGDEEQELKRGVVSTALLPDLAIIDPELTKSCPSRVTAASGVDAFTHAIESYVAPKANPYTKMYAQKAMEMFPEHIEKAVHHGGDMEARIGMSWVSNLAGVSLANAGVGAVHALAYPLGGKFHIEHGVANALLLPYVFEVTGEYCLKEMYEIAAFLGIALDEKGDALEHVIQYLQQLLVTLGLPTNLKELKVDQGALPVLAEQAAKVDRLISNTPYILTEKEIFHIYERAYEGF